MSQETSSQPDCLIVTVEETSVMVYSTPVSGSYERAITANVRNKSGILLASCTAKSEATAVRAAVQVGIAVWRATR